MQSLLVNLVIVEDDGDPRAAVRNWRLTMNVGGVAFPISEVRRRDVAAALDVFARRLRTVLAATMVDDDDEKI